MTVRGHGTERAAVQVEVRAAVRAAVLFAGAASRQQRAAVLVPRVSLTGEARTGSRPAVRRRRCGEETPLRMGREEHERADAAGKAAPRAPGTDRRWSDLRAETPAPGAACAQHWSRPSACSRLCPDASSDSFFFLAHPSTFPASDVLVNHRETDVLTLTLHASQGARAGQRRHGLGGRYQ